MVTRILELTNLIVESKQKTQFDKTKNTLAAAAAVIKANNYSIPLIQEFVHSLTVVRLALQTMSRCEMASGKLCSYHIFSRLFPTHLCQFWMWKEPSFFDGSSYSLFNIFFDCFCDLFEKKKIAIFVIFLIFRTILFVPETSFSPSPFLKIFLSAFSLYFNSNEIQYKNDSLKFFQFHSQMIVRSMFWINRKKITYLLRKRVCMRWYQVIIWWFLWHLNSFWSVKL